MTETNMPDPWARKPEINIDDGSSFERGYDTNTLTLSSINLNLTKTVGCWKINGSFHVHVAKRPNRLNRFMTRFLLGWEWNDT